MEELCCLSFNTNNPRVCDPALAEGGKGGGQLVLRARQPHLAV